MVRQIDHSRPQPAQKFAPPAFCCWLEKQRHLAERVVVCYDAGCFGYEPARRAQGRLRAQLRRQIQRMQAMGRSLLLQREMAVSGCWWRGTTWVQIVQGMPPWVVGQLEIWKKLIELTEKEALESESQLKAAAPHELIFGEGELTHELLERELIDAQRFKNGRQAGNYFGLCPSESTTSESRRMGSITQHGNPRLRRLIVELAWRVSRFQPRYRALRRWGPLLQDPKASAGARKKAIVALVRRLAVDLWHMATGRVKGEELGLFAKQLTPK